MAAPLPIPPTPILTYHARCRCEEMNIPTKAVKRLLRGNNYTVYDTNVPDRKMVLGPDFALIANLDLVPARIITVLYRGEFDRSCRKGYIDST